jgi:putative phosphoesterase
MKCIVFSDTHGNYPLAVEVISQSAQVDMIFHLGDGAEDASILEHLYHGQVIKVAGNCDAPGKYPREIITMAGETRLLLTHGDLYGVKSGLSKLVERAITTVSDVVLYGHTHQASIDMINGILFVNPGSLQKNSASQSYALLSLNNHSPEARIILIED